MPRARLVAAAIAFGLGLLSLAAGPVAAKDSLLTVAPGVRLHVIDQGPAAASAKPTLVLVPGWTFDAHIWDGQIARFAGDRRVIAIDPRSQGESTKTAVGDTPEQRARDLKAVLDQLHAGPIVLVGWSQGVQDVAAFINAYGTHDLKGVVLVDSTVSSGAAAIERDPKGAASQFALFDIYAKAPRDYLRGMLGAIIRKPQAPGVIDNLLTRSMRTPPAIGEAMVIDDLFGPDRTGALAKFDKPTLVIASGFSPELEAQRAMAAKLASGRIEVVQGAGHAVFIDDPARFDALLDAFLGSLD